MRQSHKKRIRTRFRKNLCLTVLESKRTGLYVWYFDVAETGEWLKFALFVWQFLNSDENKLLNGRSSLLLRKPKKIDVKNLSTKTSGQDIYYIYLYLHDSHMICTWQCLTDICVLCCAANGTIKNFVSCFSNLSTQLEVVWNISSCCLSCLRHSSRSNWHWPDDHHG